MLEKAFVVLIGLGFIGAVVFADAAVRSGQELLWVPSLIGVGIVFLGSVGWITKQEEQSGTN